MVDPDPGSTSIAWVPSSKNAEQLIIQGSVKHREGHKLVTLPSAVQNKSTWSFFIFGLRLFPVTPKWCRARQTRSKDPQHNPLTTTKHTWPMCLTLLVLPVVTYKTRLTELLQVQSARRCEMNKNSPVSCSLSWFSSH